MGAAMNGDTRSNQAFQIVQALADLPGSQAINITTRRFPRFGPDPVGQMYQETTQLISVDQLPGALNVPADAEEVQIVLQGATEDAPLPSDLVAKLNEFFAESDIAGRWNVRAEVHRNGQAKQNYQLRVFS